MDFYQFLIPRSLHGRIRRSPPRRRRRTVPYRSCLPLSLLQSLSNPTLARSTCTPLICTFRLVAQELFYLNTSILIFTVNCQINEIIHLFLLCNLFTFFEMRLKVFVLLPFVKEMA